MDTWQAIATVVVLVGLMKVYSLLQARYWYGPTDGKDSRRDKPGKGDGDA